MRSRFSARAPLPSYTVSGKEWRSANGNEMIDVPESVRCRFVAAGWFPARHVSLSSALPQQHPAAPILAAFGGLTVSQPEDTEGEECGLDDLAFCELFPDDTILRGWAGLLETRLVGIANIHHGHGEWYMAEDGRIFGRSCIHDAFWLAGLTFWEAVERSCFGRRVKPMLRPDQANVRLYGKLFTAESPEVYQYK